MSENRKGLRSRSSIKSCAGRAELAAQSENSRFIYQWFILVVALLAFGGLIAHNQLKDYRQIDAQERDRLSAQAVIVEKNIVPQLQLTNLLIDGILKDLPSWQAEKDGFKRADHLLKVIDDATIGISPILIIRADGKVVASSNKKLIGMNFSQREYFQTAIRNPDPKILHISSPFKTVLGSYVVSLFRVIPGAHGEFAGIVIVSAVPEYFSTLLDSVRYSGDMWSAIVHGDGKLYLISPDKAGVIGKDLARPGSFFTRHMQSGKIANVFSGAVYATGEKRMVALRTILPATPRIDKPLVVFVTRDLGVLFASWRKNSYQQMLLVFLMSGICTLGLFVNQRRQRVQIGEREQADELLRESQARFQAFYDLGLVGLTITSPEKGWLQINDCLCNMLGYTEDELKTMTWTQLTHPDDIAEDDARFKQILAGEIDGYELEKRFLTRGGGVIFTKLVVRCVRKSDGSVDYIAAMVEDITTRKQAEESLITSESHYRSLFDSSLIGVMVTDRNFVITDANDAFCNMLSYCKDELVGKMSFTDISHPDDTGKSLDNIEKLMAHETDHFSLEKRYLTKTGATVSALIYVRGQYGIDGEYEGTTGSCLDITEFKKANESLRVSEAQYRNLFDNSEIAMFRSRLDGSQLLDANRKFFDMLGLTREQALGKPSMVLWADPKERDEMVQRLLADGRLSAYEYKMLDHQGKIRNCLTSLVLYREEGILEGSILDMTELKRAEQERLHLEQQLLHAQKLESLGILAGGIAHDFNNILTSIVGNAELALMRVNPASPAVENLQKIEQASARAADLAKQMLAYSGKGKFVVESLDLNLLLEEMLHMLEVSISKKVMLRLKLAPQLPSVEADATQLRQIVMNLVINASEAIGEKSGVIAITTGCLDCDRSYLKNVWLDKNLKEGLYVYLEIADNGCGMDSTTKAKLFDPFFTTKFTGRGLGMAAVLGIVRGHKGAIAVYSEPEKGTTFKILFPASDRPADIFDRDGQAGDWKGEGKVLLVDDEETIRDIGKEMLQELGFTVVTAKDGREAVEIFKRNPDLIFVVLDLTMPDMDGEQCFRELKRLDPEVKVIMSSGFSEHEVGQKFAGKGLAGFIQKPYKMSELQEAIAPLFSR